MFGEVVPPIEEAIHWKVVVGTKKGGPFSRAKLRQLQGLFEQWTQEDAQLPLEEADRLHSALDENRGLKFRQPDIRQEFLPQMQTSFLLDTGPPGLLAHDRLVQHGTPTADASALDADVLIAAQAIELQATVQILAALGNCAEIRYRVAKNSG